MSNVLVEKQKLDILANAISAKSGESVEMTIDEMASAVDGIKIDPTLASVRRSYTPDTSAITESITTPSGYDGIGSVDITVKALNQISFPTATSSSFSGSQIATITSSSSENRYLNIPSGYNPGRRFYRLYTPQMTLPTSTSSTSSGTLKLEISPSDSSCYINIPTGHNATGAYYRVLGAGYYVGGNVLRYNGEVWARIADVSFTVPESSEWTEFYGSYYCEVYFDSPSNYSEIISAVDTSFEPNVEIGDYSIGGEGYKTVDGLYSTGQIDLGTNNTCSFSSIIGESQGHIQIQVSNASLVSEIAGERGKIEVYI